MTDKKYYSFLGIDKVKEGETRTSGVINGLVTKVYELKTVNDKQVFAVDIVTNNTAKKLNYALNAKLEEKDSTFIRVVFWEQLAERASKVIRNKTVIEAFGSFTLKSYKNREDVETFYVEVSAKEFDIKKFPPKDESNEGTVPNDSKPADSKTPVSGDAGEIPF